MQFSKCLGLEKLLSELDFKAGSVQKSDFKYAVFFHNNTFKHSLHQFGDNVVYTLQKEGAGNAEGIL